MGTQLIVSATFLELLVQRGPLVQVVQINHDAALRLLQQAVRGRQSFLLLAGLAVARDGGLSYVEPEYIILLLTIIVILADIAHLAELSAVIVTVVDVSGLFVRIGIMVVEILVARRAVAPIALVRAVLEKGGICTELALIIAEAELVGR